MWNCPEEFAPRKQSQHESGSDEIQYSDSLKENREAHQCQDCGHHIYIICGMNLKGNDGEKRRKVLAK
jgi:hypothetical protein